jgi:hypothetical protein
MPALDWQGFLRQWNTDILARAEARAELPRKVVKAGWLGFPGATEEQIARAESRLGTILPPSYRAFLRVSNGWRLAPLWIERLWSTEEINWFAVHHQGWIDAWRAADLHPLPIPDEQYRVYGRDQDTVALRLEYLQTALQISPNKPDASAVYLLNPQITTGTGEWEAWYLGNRLPGARRYRSFQEMMQAIYADLSIGVPVCCARSP